MSKKKILDVCCSEGGASFGYHLAGFEVTGVDINPQPNYPFTFIQADGIDFIKKHGCEYDAIHISPPCQAFTVSTFPARSLGKTYPNLIPDFRNVIQNLNIPVIIENVPTSPMRCDIQLTGLLFGLKVIRKRIFELHNFFMLQPALPVKVGSVKNGDFISVYGNGHYIDKRSSSQPKFKKSSVLETWSYAMGITHKMSYKGLAESIPPAYTHYIGSHLMEYLSK